MNMQMAFINDWQAKLNDSYAEFAKLVPDAPDIDLNHGIVATAIIWPILELLQEFDDEAMQAVQKIVGKDDAKQIFKYVQNWSDNRLLTSRELSELAKGDNALQAVLSLLIKHFDAWEHFPKHLATSIANSQGQGDVFNLTEQIKAGMVNIGGVANIQNQTVTIQMIMSQTDQNEAHHTIDFFPFEPETVEVPAGLFWMGSEPGEDVSEWEFPKTQIELLSYRIGKYPVTNEQYRVFVQSTGQQVAPVSGWEGTNPPKNKLNYPIVGVTWYDALAYCEWLTEQTGRKYMLPSEAEWEKAAGGIDGRIYPWGNDWNTDFCNCGNSQVTPVDKFPKGVSPVGCHDMIGNVREWTSTIWGIMRPYPDPQFFYPWADDGRDSIGAGKFLYRVYRGGAASDHINQLRCRARAAFSPEYPGSPGKWHGFRVVIKHE